MSMRTLRETPTRPLLEWRRRRLLALGLSQAAATRLAEDNRVDLHALLDMVDGGCPPQLAVRILAPLDDGPE
jgi:hypothetical protein